MSYLHVDDNFPHHSKVIGLSHRSFRLHVTALCHCAQTLTDGLITKQALNVIGAISGKGKALTDELENAGLWLPVPDGWLIHDYLDWNPSREEVQTRKQTARANARKRWGHAKGNATGITAGSANGNAKPNALPSPGLRALAIPPTVVQYVGDDSRESGDKTVELIRACGGTRAAGDKISRAIKSRKPTYETIARAIDAARSPCDDPLAVALAIIAPKRASA